MPYDPGVFRLILDGHHRDHATIDGRLHAADDWTATDDNGRVYAGRDWIDVTDFTPADLYRWLGY